MGTDGSVGDSALMRRAWSGCRNEQLVRRFLVEGVGDSSSMDWVQGLDDGLAWNMNSSR